MGNELEIRNNIWFNHFYEYTIRLKCWEFSFYPLLVSYKKVYTNISNIIFFYYLNLIFITTDIYIIQIHFEFSEFARIMYIFLLFDKIILALSKPLMIFDSSDIVLILFSIKVNFKKCLKTCVHSCTIW